MSQKLNQFNVNVVQMKKFLSFVQLFSVLSANLVQTENFIAKTVKTFDCNSNKISDLKNCPIESAEASALSQIVRDFFANGNKTFDIIVYGENMQILGDIANEVLKSTEIPTKLIKYEIEEEFKIRVNQSAILFFDDLVSYLKFHNISRLGNEYPKDIYFFVYINGLEFDMFDKIRTDIDDYLYTLEYFVVRDRHNGDDSSLWLRTDLIFQLNHCREYRQSDVNKFSVSNRTWMNTIFVIDKFSNYNGCKMAIGVYWPQVPVTKHDEEKNLTVIGGYGHVINEEISKKLNYTFTYVIYDMLKNRSVNNETLSVDFDIIEDSVRNMNQAKYQGSILTTTVTTMDEIILISRSAPYSPFTKIFLPFEIEVWHWLIGTLTLFAVAVCFFKLTPKFVQRFVFGLRVRTPMLNLL
jgi:hypothetical protein